MIPILKAVLAFGTDEAPRYAIQNLVNSEIWNGDCFSPDWSQARLYAQPNHASIDMRKIMMHVYREEKLTLYHCPTKIEVFGEHDMRRLQHWLSRAAIMRIRNSEYGNGPGDSLAMPAIHWAEMKRADQ